MRMGGFGGERRRGRWRCERRERREIVGGHPGLRFDSGFL